MKRIYLHSFTANIQKMGFKTTKRAVILLPPFVLIIISSIYILQKYVAYKEPYFINWSWSETISCHYVTEEDALPAAEDLSPPEDSIFFHETSCRGGLNSREACSIESAARKHPKRTVYVFFSSPVSGKVLEESCLVLLKTLPNVKLARLHATEYAKGTVLEEMLANKENNRSAWGIELTSDMLRYISMYKYGGMYLDTDVLVARSLDILGRDWVAREDDTTVNVAVMAIGKEGLGHEIVTQVLEDLRVNYRPDLWLHNGPGTMNRVLLRFCNATNIIDLNENKCHGFKVYHSSKIYPVHWQDSNSYFEVGELPKYSRKVFTHHLWNKMTRNTPIEKGSLYDRLAWQHCPAIREMYRDKFGM